MTLPIERARSRKPITWLTVLGILLLPAAVGGILVAALQNPAERLDSMTAAIVNLDEPVEIDGQLTPLGRQLASGLVEGSDELDSNLTWVISNEDDAEDGLADGSYQAVITIPEDFSEAATSAGQAISDGGGDAEQATIQVTTPDDGLVADDLITSQIANVAASSLGTMLSEATTENILVGFTTIGDQIGEAADGAAKLATGSRDAATGAAAIPDGATQLASGASELGTGASSLADGLDTPTSKTREAAAGASQIGLGLTTGASELQKNADGMTQLVGAIQTGTGAATDAARGAFHQCGHAQRLRLANLRRHQPHHVVRVGLRITWLIRRPQVHEHVLVRQDHAQLIGRHRPQRRPQHFGHWRPPCACLARGPAQTKTPGALAGGSHRLRLDQNLKFLMMSGFQISFFFCPPATGSERLSATAAPSTRLTGRRFCAPSHSQ